jgi:hypothetical protein
MIYEDELPTWKVANIVSGSDEYVKFAFECNECTSHDNTEDNDIETSFTK